MSIHEKMLSVMQSVSEIGKNKKNNFQGYMFRSIDDVYNVFHEPFIKAGMVVVPEIIGHTIEKVEATNDRGQLKTSFHALAILKVKFMADGEFLEAIGIGEGIDTSDKAMNKAVSYAYKDIMLKTFCVPTVGEIDGDSESPQIEQPKNNTTKNTKEKTLKEEAKEAFGGEELPKFTTIEQGKDIVAKLLTELDRTLDDAKKWMKKTFKLDWDNPQEYELGRVIKALEEMVEAKK